MTEDNELYGLSSAADQTDSDFPDAWNDMPHPQDDLPAEVVEMYVMKDYQRMLEAFHKYRKLAAMNAKHIENRALAIASRRKSGTIELTDLKLKLEDRDRKINEMYDWLRQKETLINSLRTHCARQRDMLAVHIRNLSAQRQQIQSLLNHYDDEDARFNVLSDAEDAWNPGRWKQAIVEIHDLRQDTTDLYDAIGQLPVSDEVREVLKKSLWTIRQKSRRCYNVTARIANTVLRKEFGADIIPEDEEGQDLAND